MLLTLKGIILIKKALLRTSRKKRELSFLNMNLCHPHQQFREYQRILPILYLLNINFYFIIITQARSS